MTIFQPARMRDMAWSKTEFEEILWILKNEIQINIMCSCITCILKITYMYVSTLCTLKIFK